MKRLLLHVVISILAFCFGLGVNRALTFESRPRVAPLNAEPQYVKPIIVEMSATPVATVVTPTHVIADYDVNDFYPEGEYYFADQPRDFNEFNYLSLGRMADSNGTASGLIQLGTKSNGKYENHDAAYGLITEKRLFFVTAASSEEQLQYWFDGEIMMQKSGAYLIKGKLTKTKHGRKIAERKVTFYQGAHAC